MLYIMCKPYCGAAYAQRGCRAHRKKSSHRNLVELIKNA